MAGSFSRPKAATRQESAIPRPENCGVAGCHEKAAVAVRTYVSPSGAIRLLSGEMQQAPAGWRHEGWIARCADHYIAELYRSGKGQRSDIGPGFTPTPEEVAAAREAWRSQQPGPPP